MRVDERRVKRMRASLVVAALASALAATMIALSVALVAQGSGKSGLHASPLGQPFGADAAVVLTPETIGSMSRGGDADWRATVNAERPRGGADLYAKVAPAVAVVRTSHGHGTGFFIQPDGTLLTNHHVVESGLRQDAQRGATYATVYIGRLGPDGMMQLRDEPLRAHILKVDAHRDLALLKVAPPKPVKFPSLAFATGPPRPGLECAIVGHPGSGLLWTYRLGQVSGVGEAPRDLVGPLMERLAISGPRRSVVEQRLAKEPSFRLLLTSTGAGPGDSGGPLLDSTGAVIGVTHAVTGEARQAKFTYHIHMEEVRQFLLNAPHEPMVIAPNPWHFGPRAALRDVDNNGVPDAVVAGESRPDVILFDLDNDTPRQFFAGDDPLQVLVGQRRWDFEFAIDVRGSGYDTFYDTDNDGTLDLVLTTDEARPVAKDRVVLGAGGRWRVERAPDGQLLLSAEHFKDRVLARRMAALQPMLDSLVR
jgi:S1-C subfamily serine protease